jgi:hypothetical protein
MTLVKPTTTYDLRGWSAYKRLPNHAHYIQTYLHDFTVTTALLPFHFELQLAADC